jgi:hypothetical protein
VQHVVAMRRQPATALAPLLAVLVALGMVLAGAAPPAPLTGPAGADRTGPGQGGHSGSSGHSGHTGQSAGHVADGRAGIAAVRASTGLPHPGPAPPVAVLPVPAQGGGDRAAATAEPVSVRGHPLREDVAHPGRAPPSRNI